MKKKIPIKLIENHDQAYYFWKKLCLSKRPLIHLDAHMDFNFHPAKPLRQTLEEAKSKEDLTQQLSKNLAYKELNIKEDSLTNIGNYIYPAMRDGIVSDFYWVIPGDRQEFKRSLKKLLNILKSFFRQDPFKTRKITKVKGGLIAKIYGRDFIITTLQDLPENIKGAILDIDTDYLVTDTIRKAGVGRDIGKRFPWIWPEELVNQLKKKKMRPSCMTIAYSVEGGYTPLIYKFLGDEIAIFLNSTNKRLKEIILMKNKAFAFFREGKIKKTVYTLEKALQNLNTVRINSSSKNRLKAHIVFILFRYHAKQNNFAKARFYYDLAVTSDKTYRVEDSNYGPLYLRKKGNFKKAEREFKIILSADKDNPYALSGLANIFMKRKDFKKARLLFIRAYAVDRKNREALFGLSRIELRLKNYKAALKHLKDYKSKNRMPGATHSLLAQVYEGLRMFDEALKEYKLASCLRMDPSLYLRLFEIVKKTDIPEKHKKWIKSRINTYKNYRKNFLSLRRKYPNRFDIRAKKRISKLLNRIDNILKNVEQKSACHRT